MLNFLNNEEVFKYIKKKFSAGNKLILIRGSTATAQANKFSDFDIEVFGSKPKKPDYEIAFIKEQPVLITAYYYKYRAGEETQEPTNVKIILGRYNENVEKSIKDSSKEVYTSKQKIKREVQLAIDSFFKYLRTNNKEYLKPVQRRI